MTICIPIETSVRELDGKLLLATLLLDANYEVLIGGRSQTKKYALAKGNCIYLAKSLTIAEVKFYKDLKKRNCLICLLHAEGGIYSKDMTNSIHYSYPKELNEFIDLIFVYGQAVKDKLVEIFPYLNNKIVVTGDPRFDLLKEKYHSLYEREIQDLRTQYGQFILINTSFGISNHLLGDKYAYNLLENTLDFTENQRSLLIRKMNSFKEIVASFIELITYLSCNLQGYNIIVRHHPEENMDTYKKVTTGLKNVHVVHEGNVVKWIIASEGTIHYDCTTGVESFMAGKKTLSYAIDIDEEITAWLPLYVSSISNSKEGILSLIKEEDVNETNGITEDQKRKTLSEYLYNVYHESSAIIVDSLINRLSLGVHVKSIKFQLLKIYLWGKLIKVLRLLGKKQKLSTSTYKLGTFKKQEILSKVKELAHTQGIDSDFKCKIIQEGLFKLYR